jgi:paraquat-inducible protein B
MSESGGNLPPTPESNVVSRKRTRLSFVWLIPIVAAIAGIWVAATQILGEGPEITIVFQSAEGLEAGKTKIEYDGVEVGTLTALRLSDDHQRVIATAEMEPKTEGFLVEDTRFWVVRPRISGGTVSGLGTLLSGAYVGMEIGESEKAQRSFEALKVPPILISDLKGRSFTLHTPTLGSLENGTAIYFRRLKVGEVVSYEIESDGKSFRVKAFIYAPYDQFVTPDTRFWHASGIDVSLTASGFSLQTESLVSILIGGIAFETPTTSAALAPAEEKAKFTLFHDRAQAFRPPAQNPETYVFVFDDDVRGLEPGAPIDFRGVQIGEVLDVVGKLDQQSYEFKVYVTVTMDPARFGVEDATTPATQKRVVDALIARGVRAQLRTGSLLSGSQLVGLDFFPDAAPATIDWSQQPPQLPTTPGQLQALEQRVASILDKVDQIPFKAIGDDLRKALEDLDTTLVSARGTLDEASDLIAPNGVLGQELESTLSEVSGAARSLRVLADYLERHPEALIRGKTGEAK